MDLTEPDQHSGAAPIRIPDPNDILYRPDGMIPFTRSEYNSSKVPREQINQITAVIDGSGVYGSDETKARSLRTLRNGEMNMTLVSSRGHKVLDLLPRDGTGMFLAGDIRANEQVGLISLHTLFLREHNRLCDKIKFRFGSASDEKIYQLARKIVGAELQAITYKEFLPALLGPMAPATYRGYNKNVDPSIATEFSTAAYRFGHSMLSPELQLYFKNRHKGTIRLRHAFFRPDFLVSDPIHVDYLIGGFIKQKAQEVDHMIIDDVRNFLFGRPGEGGFDLAALNIQRGRDHGIPKYNKVRKAYKLSRNKSWEDVSSNEALREKLKRVYDSPNDMDAWVGGLCEDHVDGASVGELIGTVLKDQFTRTREGDPFFYMRDDDLQNKWVQKHIRNVDTVTLADIIRDNTQIQNIKHKNVFFAQQGNFYVDEASKPKPPSSGR